MRSCAARLHRARGYRREWLRARLVGGISASLPPHALAQARRTPEWATIGTTGASALAAGSAIEDVDAADTADALFLLVVVAGIVMAVAGLAGLGRCTRFVWHSVMTGFLTGIAFNIVAGQIPDLTVADASGSVALAKAVDVIGQPARIDLASLAAGAGALALLAATARSAAAADEAAHAWLVIHRGADTRGGP